MALHASADFDTWTLIDLPEGIAVRPLTFVDNMLYSETLVRAMVGRDVAFGLMERSPAAFMAARWAGLPLYYQFACVGYGAFEGEHLAGLLYLRGWRQALHVDALTVHPDYRRRGIGRALLRMAEQQARHLGRCWLSLRVTASNEAAVRLYESEGFGSPHRRMLLVDGKALARQHGTERDGSVSLHPLIGPGARAAYLTHAQHDLSHGNGWAAEILAAQMATRPPVYGRRRWLCRARRRETGYMSLSGRADRPRLYLASQPEGWGTEEETALLGAALRQLARVPEQVEVQLASRGHHEATLRALGSLQPIEKPIAKITMLKSLTELATSHQIEGGQDGP